MASAKSASGRVSNRKRSAPTSAKRSTTAKTTPIELDLNLSPLSGSFDCHYDVEVRLEESYDHDADGGDYCRCRTIDSAEVIDVYHNLIARRFFKTQKGTNPFMLYAIERILRAYLRPNTFGDFHVSWGRGYYGEELHSVTMPVPTGMRDAILRLVAPIKAKLPVEFAVRLADRCVREALLAEYGHVLPQLVGKLWTTEIVRRDKIVVPGMYHPLDRRVVESYRGNTNRLLLPQGIAIANGVGGFDLIDGRHRFAAAEDEKKIRLIVGR